MKEETDGSLTLIAYLLPFDVCVLSLPQSAMDWSMI